MRPPNPNPTDQLVFFVNYNTMSIEIPLGMTTHDSEHEIETEKSGEEKEEEEEEEEEEEKGEQSIPKLHV